MAKSEFERRVLIGGVLIGGIAGFAYTCVLLHLSIWWGLAAILPGMVIVTIEYQAAHGSRPAEIALRSAWSLTMVAAVLVWFPMIIMVIGDALFHYAPGRNLNWIAVVVWPIGWAAYHFKQYNSAYYGIVEIVVGVATAFATTLKGQFGTAQGLAIVGAMYIVSRGYGNIADAAKRRDEIERNAQAFLDYRGRVKIASSNLWRTVRGRRVESVTKAFRQK
jgi:hypothetical protein